MKPSQISVLLNHSIPQKMPVLLKGPPGIGKTEMVRQAVVSAGADLIISHPVVSDPTDYKGLPFVVDGSAEFLPFGELESLINADSLTVFFLDDLGQAPPAVQAGAMQLILERRINGHKVSDHVVFCAATNRKRDMAGVTGILEPVKSRFAALIEVEVDIDDWVAWALDTMPAELIAFIRFRPELLHQFEPSRDIVNTPSPRTVAAVGEWINSGLPKNLEYDVFSGAAGEGFAAEFLSFLKVYRKLPDPNRIILDPDGVPVPDDPSALYATAGALVNLAGENTFGNIMRYISRMPAEFSVFPVKDMITKNHELTYTKEYIEWAIKNKDVII